MVVIRRQTPRLPTASVLGLSTHLIWNNNYNSSSIVQYHCVTHLLKILRKVFRRLTLLKFVGKNKQTNLYVVFRLLFLIEVVLEFKSFPATTAFKSWIKNCTDVFILVDSPTVAYVIYSNRKGGSEWYVPGIYSLDKSKRESAQCRETAPFQVLNWYTLNKHSINWEKKGLGYDFLVTLRGFNITVSR